MLTVKIQLRHEHVLLIRAEVMRRGGCGYYCLKGGWCFVYIWCYEGWKLARPSSPPHCLSELWIIDKATVMIGTTSRRYGGMKERYASWLILTPHHSESRTSATTRHFCPHFQFKNACFAFTITTGTSKWRNEKSVWLQVHNHNESQTNGMILSSSVIDSSLIYWIFDSLIYIVPLFEWI